MITCHSCFLRSFWHSSRALVFSLNQCISTQPIFRISRLLLGMGLTSPKVTPSPPMNPASVSLRVVNHISAMVAYWDRDEKCVFSNEAYQEWFGKDPDEMVGMSMKDLLGPLYEKNLPFIRAALCGERQVFERQIPLPNGEIRESIATYTPDIIDGIVQGFSVHVANVTTLKKREAALEQAIAERDEALAEVRTLRGLIPICAGCKNIRDDKGEWHSVEHYVSQRTDASFSHGMCPVCMKSHYPDIVIPSE